MMRELEKTYLAKYVPKGIARCKSKEIIDIYIPESVVHPTLRIRKMGDHHEITKKAPVNEADSSHQTEQTIKLTKEELGELSKLDGKKIHKLRYYYPYRDMIVEFDVFQGDLKGLIVVDFEFESEEEKDSFLMPDFCLADVTQEKFVAGGMLSGKKYDDIAIELKKFEYKKLFL